MYDSVTGRVVRGLGELERPAALAWDRAGNLLVTDNAGLHVFAPRQQTSFALHSDSRQKAACWLLMVKPVLQRGAARVAPPGAGRTRPGPAPGDSPRQWQELTQQVYLEAPQVIIKAAVQRMVGLPQM